jgi:hypothetical protein
VPHSERRAPLTRPTARHALALAALLAPAAARAERPLRQRLPYPTPLWAAAQLVPSPELVVTGGAAWLGLRWQLSPLLLAFGLRRAVHPWRVLVADPIARYGGSVELVVSPEYLALPGGFERNWALRTGLRGHVPVLGRGESLALSFGVSHTLFRQEHSVAFEAGACTLFGLLGVALTWHPRFQGSDAWIVTLRLRYL